MKSFYEKEEYNLSDIQSLIDNEVEESIYLEFKEAGALDKSDGKRKDISKDVSSFANSDGGIIIYGIREENHKASELSFIDGNNFTKEWLEQLINSTIHRHIPFLKIFPVRQDGNIEKSIYVVKIPKSLEAPHLSKDKRFYKRFNFESVMMEEYEIRQLYGQKIKSKLVIDTWSVSRNETDSKSEVLSFECEGDIFNDGDIVENSYKLNVYIINMNKYIDISWRESKTNYDYTILDNNRIKLSAVGLVPVFPNETVNVIRFNIQVNKSNLLDAFKDIKIELILYYSNGEDKMETDLSKILNKTQVFLQKDNF